MREPPQFAVIIVNYNCAPFALDAALSAIGDGAISAVIVDNGSIDGSMAYFRQAASGALTPKQQAERAGPSCPPGDHAPKFASLADVRPVITSIAAAQIRPGITVIDAGENNGFAAGCNIGLEALITAGVGDHFLLLNPDAVIARGSLNAFASRLTDRRAGLCGASVLRWQAPHQVQAFGGASLNKYTLLGRNIGEGDLLPNAPAREDVEAMLDYPLGAAIALRKDYIGAAGFLDERYFLYYEEADWTLAGAPALKPVWAPGAVVFHRYGASSKSEKSATQNAPSARSPLADYHMARSRLLFAAKWRPMIAPLTIAAGGMQAGRRLLRGKPAGARAVAMGSLPGAARSFQ